MSGTVTQLQTEVAALQAAVASNTTVEQSAITLINGFAAQITAAVADAVAAGADPASLTSITDVTTQLTTESAALAAAVAANTPAASPGP